MKRSDGQIEQLVEDWLDDEARPMPQHVLESSLEAVARTTQVGRRSAVGVRWPSQRVLAFAAAAVVLVLAVLAGPNILDTFGNLFGPRPGGPGPSAGPRQVWDPAAEFLPFPNEANPSPDRYGNDNVWSYLRSASDAHDPAEYSLLPEFSVVNGSAMIWEEAALFSLQVRYMLETGTIWFHPWSDGDRSHNHHAILGWRSPVTGSLIVSGRVEHTEPTCIAGNTDGTYFFIDHGSETLQSLYLNPGGSDAFAVTVDVDAGDSLYFVVDPGRASNCDTTSLQLTITLD